jgi:hypothetical protein
MGVHGMCDYAGGFIGPLGVGLVLDWVGRRSGLGCCLRTRDLLKSFGWGIAALHRLDAATKLPFPRRAPHSISRFRH